MILTTSRCDLSGVPSVVLVDTSVWIEIFRDKHGSSTQALKHFIADDVYTLTRFNQLELLQGAKDAYEWRRLDEYLQTQYYLETSPDTWREAARIYFDLRKRGITVASPIDCCIAQLAIENHAVLLHKDNDFLKIAKVRPLRQSYFKPLSE